MELIIEQITSHSYRVRTHINGIRYSVVTEYKPTEAQAAKLLQEKIGKGIYYDEIPDATDIYFIENPENGRIKIGITGNIKARKSNLETSACCELILINSFTFERRNDALEYENKLHTAFEQYRIVLPGGRKTEWFTHDVKKLLPRSEEELRRAK